MKIPKYFNKYKGFEFQQQEIEAARILAEAKDRDVMEFGSGCSTFFYSPSAKSWTTVEPVKEYYSAVVSENMPNVIPFWIPQDMPNDWYPDRQLIERIEKEKNFRAVRAYVKKPYFTGFDEYWPIVQYLRYKKFAEFPLTTDKTFDVVFIDGRAKVFCAINSLKCLRPGGIVLMHDFSREEYAPVRDYYNVVEYIREGGDLGVLTPK